jgi:hypothetical protein
MPDVNAKYHVLFLDADNGLGAAVEFSGKQAGGETVTVKLAPCGNATVRFVDDHGKPVVGYRPKVWARIPPYPDSIHINEVVNKPEDFRVDGSVWLARMDRARYANGPVTDADGRVTLPNLIPGASYQISTDQPSHSFWEQGVNFTVKSGQTTKLADIVLKSAQKQAEPSK